MQRHERASLEAVEAVVKPLGLTAEFKTGRRHCVIEVTGRGRRYKLAVSSSPRAGEVEAANYARQRTVRWLRSEGLMT